MSAICQSDLRDAPWMDAKTRRLPGVQPLEMSDWLQFDDAYAAQMAERGRILAEHRDEVLKRLPEASAAEAELYELVVQQLAARPGFELSTGTCLCPDGREVRLDPDAPFETLNQLVTEDFCILQKSGDQHRLTAALLCFPASWSLAEKFGHDLTRIHGPVPNYDADMARRVQRLFDAVQPHRPLWRANALDYEDPALHQPRTEAARRENRTSGLFIRSERQSILRLPESGAVIFSIHTRQIRHEALTQAQLAGLAVHPIETEGGADVR